MRNNNLFIGIILISVGILFSLQSFGLVDTAWTFLWPVFLLVPGLGFHVAFFATGAKKSAAGLLVPGGILLVLSALFFFEIVTSWQFSGSTWPVYLFAVAFGLFELYLFGGRTPALLIPVFVLTVVGGIFFFDGLLELPVFNLWPLALIGAGLIVIFGRQKGTEAKNKG